jgi:ribosomal protein S18 acetylase RimI-like enzyme
MSAPASAVIRLGRERARTGRWRGEDDVALITPIPDAPFLSADFIRHCLRMLSNQGFRRVVTGALSPLEQAGFLAAGFDVEEHLRLLAIELSDQLPPVPPGPPIRRVPRWRRPEVLAVDRAAFMEFWQFDSAGLVDALSATPSVRFRMVVGADGKAAAYAICGRSGSRGFVQRLAVRPGSQRSGSGARLLLDGLHWMKRHGVVRAVVNTQVGNEAALSLYLKTGFKEEPTGLSVLSTGLP